MKRGDIFIKDTWYDSFSIEKKTFGGAYSQKELKEALKEVGIRYTTKGAYTIYQGHWAIYIESEFADEVSEWLWGHSYTDLVGRGNPNVS